MQRTFHPTRRLVVAQVASSIGLMLASSCNGYTRFEMTASTSYAGLPPCAKENIVLKGIRSSLLLGIGDYGMNPLFRSTVGHLLAVAQMHNILVGTGEQSWRANQDQPRHFAAADTRRDLLKSAPGMDVLLRGLLRGFPRPELEVSDDPAVPTWKQNYNLGHHHKFGKPDYIIGIRNHILQTMQEESWAGPILLYIAAHGVRTQIGEPVIVIPSQNDGVDHLFLSELMEVLDTASGMSRGAARPEIIVILDICSRDEVLTDVRPTVIMDNTVVVISSSPGEYAWHLTESGDVYSSTVIKDSRNPFTQSTRHDDSFAFSASLFPVAMKCVMHAVIEDLKGRGNIAANEKITAQGTFGALLDMTQSMVEIMHREWNLPAEDKQSFQIAGFPEILDSTVLVEAELEDKDEHAVRQV